VRAGAEEIRILVERWGRSYQSLINRRNFLRQGKAIDVRHNPLPRKKNPAPERFARPSWFDNENLDTLSRGRR
jgi:hypothetical protein